MCGWKQGVVLGVHRQGDTDQVPVASSVLVCWALHQQDPGGGSWAGGLCFALQWGTSLASPHPCVPHCMLCLSRVLFGFVLDIQEDFWIMEVCYLLPGLVFDLLHLLNGGQYADTTVKSEVMDSSSV